MISYTTVKLRFHDFPCKMRYPFVFGYSVSKMAACLTDVVGMTSNARIFINDTRTQQKRCSILNTEKVRNSSTWLKIDNNVFVRNELFTKTLLSILSQVEEF